MQNVCASQGLGLNSDRTLINIEELGWNTTRGDVSGGATFGSRKIRNTTEQQMCSVFTECTHDNNVNMQKNVDKRTRWS